MTAGQSRRHAGPGCAARNHATVHSRRDDGEGRLRSRFGFTLVEVLVAMLILVVGMLGSLIGVMAASDHNLGNSLRNEAMRIAQEHLEDIRTGPFLSIAPAVSLVQRQIRKSSYTFTATTGVQTSGTLRQVTVTVQWSYKGRSRSYVAETIVRSRV
jgi:type IV pilus assembly protein PilV